MSDASFAADWLALREPVDHRSRGLLLTEAAADAGRRRGWSRALDLGSGTGSNVRYLTPRLPWIRRWTVVDHDPDLLGRIPEPGREASLERITGDLGVEGLSAVADAEFVTASALLDLVSEVWLQELVDACAAAGAGALFALSYDGSTQWAPADEGDAEVRAAVNRHQERDKGLGSALGPAATAVAEKLFREAGYRTETVPSPWILEGAPDGALARELTEGWARAAMEVEGTDHAFIRDWLRRRCDGITAGDFRVTVGHRDLLALPGG